MSRRRSNGEDSIYRDGDRWRGAVSLGYDHRARQAEEQIARAR
jgi:hypothetical protein